jgi:hypothetical protein
MPTDEQKENLLSQIGYLERSRFTNREGTVIPVIQGEPPEDAWSWAELPPHMKENAMTFQLNWEGFTPEQEFEVIENVIYDRPPFEWVDGIEPADPAPSLSAEFQGDELAARSRDHGPEDASTHEARLKAGVDSVRHLELNLPEPARDDLDRAVGDIERGWTEAASAEIGRMLADIAQPPVFEPSDYAKAKEQAAEVAESRQVDNGKEPTR